MDTKMFADEKLSKLLQERGVVSQFNFYWSSDYKREGLFHYCEGWLDEDKDQQAIHFSDLLLPENAKKIWGTEPVCGSTGVKQSSSCCAISDEWGSCEAEQRWEVLSREYLLYDIQHDKDWQSWLMSELTKQEGK